VPRIAVYSSSGYESRNESSTERQRIDGCCESAKHVGDFDKFNSLASARGSGLMNEKARLS